MGKKFSVQLVGGERHEIQTTHRDLLLTERTLMSLKLDATGQTDPVHYVTALIWAALVRLDLTASKFMDFVDQLEDFDQVKEPTGDDEDDAGADPTQPGAATGLPSI